MLILFKKIEDT